MLPSKPGTAIHWYSPIGFNAERGIMGFITPDLPDVDHDTWSILPRSARLQVVTRHWVEHGFGTPYAIYLLYVLKMVAYAGGAAAVISLTPGLGGLGQIGAWWTQPIVYQKLVVFTLLSRSSAWAAARAR